MTDFTRTLHTLAQDVRRASRAVSRAPATQRTQAIEAMAQALIKQRPSIEKANHQDVERARQVGLASAMLDRLILSGERLEHLAAAVRAIAAQADPVGQITHGWQRPNGLRIEKMRLPLGVVLMIYEARPNVTIDAAALCIRSGNGAILRGGSEAQLTNQALEKVVHSGLQAAGFPQDAVRLVPTQERQAIDALLTMDDCIDLVIPRGGEGLIRRVVAQSRIPVIKHYKGICHVYVHAQADTQMAEAIILNSKVQRPGVCNAAETLLVDAAIAPGFLPAALGALRQAGVEIRGCTQTQGIVEWVLPATDEDWHTEFLDMKLAVRVVDDLPHAIAHIDHYGSHHTASIVSGDAVAQQRFLREVDASCVLVNASTRFNDGGELGLGAEMGISTTRLHAYGPMGAEALTTEKFIVHGAGQLRA